MLLFSLRGAYDLMHSAKATRVIVRILYRNLPMTLAADDIRPELTGYNAGYGYHTASPSCTGGH